MTTPTTDYEALAADLRATGWMLRRMGYVSADDCFKGEEAIRNLLALVSEAREAMRAWDEWEAKLLMDDMAWATGIGCHIPQDLFEEYVAGPQSMRAATLTKLGSIT